MTQKAYDNIIDETLPTLAKWVRYVTKLRLEDIGNADNTNKIIQQNADAAAAALAAAVAALPAKGAGTDIDTGTDDTKYLTAKAINDSHNVPDVAPGTSGNILTSNGTDWTSAAPASTIFIGTPQATTSGTAIDFSGIPATAKRVTISFDGVSTNGTSDLLVQIGPSGGVATSGYKAGATAVAGASAYTGYTTGFGCRLGVAADTTHGTITLTLVDSSLNTWAASGVLLLYNAQNILVAGSVSLSGAISKLRLTTLAGADTFDAGAVNISYE